MPSPTAETVTIKTESSHARWPLQVAAGMIIIWGLVASREFLIPVIVAALVALMLMPVVRLLKRMRVPETAAVFLAICVLILPFIGLGTIVVTESQKLATEWPNIKASAITSYKSFTTSPFAEKYHIAEKLNISDLASKIGERASQGVTVAITSLGVLFSVGSSIGLVLFFAMSMMFARNHLKEAFTRIISRNNPAEKPAILEASVEVLEQFLAARLLIILAVAVADFIILEAFGLSYAVVLALLQGIMTLIPVFGFVVGLIPVAIIAAAYHYSGFAIGGMLVALWAISSAQDHFMTPKLIGEKLNLNFFVTYLALFAGERMWGIWGMFLAIPILGVIRVVLNASEHYKDWGRLIQEREVEQTKDDTPAQKRLDQVSSEPLMN